MTIKSVVLSVNNNGYGVFLENKATHEPVISVMTKAYIERVLGTVNPFIAQQLQEKGIPIKYDPPKDNNPEKILEFTHSVFLAQGYVDRTPHLVEVVESLYDFNEKEPDFQKAIIEIKKRYNLHLGGSFLVPPYPETVPVIHMPLPTSPI